jgi:hypothetical protein
MTTKKKKILKIGAILALSGLLIGGGIILYMFNMPHRDVQNAKIDFSLSASQLVAEYLTEPGKADENFLSNDGNSKILAVTGTVAKISDDFKGQKVVLLKDADDKAGVSCTFLPESGSNASKLIVGGKATVKGVIRSGAGYDPDLELYENVILEKCDVVNN